MKVHEKGEKIHILGTFRRLVPVHFECVPVHFVFWSFFGQCVPVHIRGVPIHPVLVFLFRPVFVFWP